MLTPYLEYTHAKSPNSLRGMDAAGYINDSFTTGLQFLHNPQRFPDAITNITAGVLERSIMSGYIHTRIPREIGLPSLSVSLTRDHVFIDFPADFHEQTRRDPIGTLGAIASAAEAARAARLLITSNAAITPQALAAHYEQSRRRIEASEAQALNCLSKMALQESLDLQLNEHSKECIRMYPHGNMSTPPGATHLGNQPPAPPELTPFHIGIITDLDFLAHTSPADALAFIGAAILRAQPEQPSPSALEQTFQAIHSPLHLHLREDQLDILMLSDPRGAQDPCRNSFKRSRKNLQRLTHIKPSL